MIENCTAVIMAGGNSRRMGQDKAGLRLGNQTLLQSVSAVMQHLFPQVLISVRQRRGESNLPQVCDTLADGGPLAGLEAALGAVATPWVFVVACDMPFVSPAVVNNLARQRGEYQAVVPMVGGQPQPLAAFYARTCADEARAILAGNGKHSLRALLSRLDVCYVDAAELLADDPQLRSFIDLDTPEDFSAASSQQERKQWNICR